MKKVSRFTLVMLVASGIIDLIGFSFGLFYAGVFYDNLAHFVTSFSLVALAAELYFRRGLARGDGAFPITVGRALAAGAVIGLVGGMAWESFESFLDLAFPETIYNPPLDTVVDTAFGTAGGAFGVWRTFARYGLISPGACPNSVEE